MKSQKQSSTARRMPFKRPTEPAGAFSGGESYPTSGERVKLISGLLNAFKRLLPNLTIKHEIEKVEYEIKYHRRMLRQARKNLRLEHELLAKAGSDNPDQ